MRTQQYRSRVVGLALSGLVVGMISGCSSSGTISPVAADPSPAAVVGVGATTEPTATTEPSATTEPAATTPPAATTEPAGPAGTKDHTLDDDGIGGLYLGQPRKAALTTGLVGPKQADLSSDLCEVHTGKGDIEFVYLVKGKVSIIAVGASVSMARGIGVGDTYAQLHVKYPTGVEEGLGKLAVAAPGAKVAAHYRVGMDSGDQVYPDSKITEIALQANDQSCYE